MDLYYSLILGFLLAVNPSVGHQNHLRSKSGRAIRPFVPIFAESVMYNANGTAKGLIMFQHTVSIYVPDAIHLLLDWIYGLTPFSCMLLVIPV